ncbi:MAG TPA: hypothetical protein PK781_09285, partial [Terrimesophilobacter sp.]|nr:hypothetical protein [Terrimesophilobacter sp.]
LNANDLADLALLAANGGRPASDGWPLAERMPTAQFLHTAPVRHPHDEGVWLGSLSALDELPGSVGSVVSLCRVGIGQVPAGVEGIRVWLIDTPGHNANLDFVLRDTVDTIASLRSEGVEVFVHCAEARSRTSAVAALYGIRHRGVEAGEVWAVLPHFDPAPFLREAVARLTGHDGSGG